VNPSIWRSMVAVLRKDLLLEWQTRTRVSALGFFALSTLLLFSFALGPDTALLRKNAGGYLWLALLFASTLALGESFRVEQENQAMDGLRLAPTDPRGLFLGKALGNATLLFLLSAMLTPVVIAVYDVSVKEGVGPLALVLLAGCLAIAAPGTVYAAIASNARARDVLLPLLLFPILIPALLAAAKGLQLVLEGDPMQQLGSWLRLLGGFNVLYWSLGFVLFPRIVEDD
jgi:heme exporter protein B